MNRANVAVVFSGLLLMVGCKSVDIKDGRIPAEYIEVAKQMEGTYVGQMDRNPVTLTVTMEGDYMRAVASPDLIAPACQSRIGDLNKVWLKEKDNSYTVTEARFALDPNLCDNDVEGRSVRFGISQKDGRIRLEAQVVTHTEWRMRCRMECRGGNGGRKGRNGGLEIQAVSDPDRRCENVCHREAVEHFMTGQFDKQ